MQKIDFYDTVPDPDSEVPKEIRDEFFKRMKSNQSERVRRLAFPATQLLLLGRAQGECRGSGARAAQSALRALQTRRAAPCSAELS